LNGKVQATKDEELKKVAERLTFHHGANVQLWHAVENMGKND